LEVECTGGDPYADARQTQSLLPAQFAITKSDGSLSNGFEICTRPASLEAHRENWSAFFGRQSNGDRCAIRTLISHDASSCGLHIHASRAPLSETAIATIVCFINLPRNARFIACVAGRDANTYCKMKRKRFANAHVPTGDKYEAVNLNHRNTIEFRSFKGTLKKATFFKSLEFVDALIHFVTSGNEYTLRSKMSAKVFVHYVRRNAHKWPILWAFIQARWKGKTPDNPEYAGAWSIRNNENPPLPPVVHNQ
jgi:hypothetical protein